MLTDARSYPVDSTADDLAGVAIVACVLAIDLTDDALRDASARMERVG